MTTAKRALRDWDTYKSLFEIHGELTIGDMMTMLGKHKSTVSQCLRRYHDRGLVNVEIVKRVGIWSLSPSEQTTSQRLASALTDAGEKA